jgi:uncharacterized spore protein YtfJ
VETDEQRARDEARRAAAGSLADTFLERLAAQIGARAGVEAVFGAPVRQGDLTVITVARTRWGVGGGSGVGPATGGDDGAEAVAMGSGSGGGGGMTADPVGYLEIRDSGAVFRPIGPVQPNPLVVIAAGIATWLVLRGLARLRHG